jgi:hypothetical protein
MPRPRTLMTSTEMINAFEVARIALEDQGFFGKIASEMDVTNEELASLYETIMDFLEGDLRHESAR